MTKEQFFEKAVRDCIRVLQAYLPPDGIKKEEVIDQILTILDNDEIVKHLEQPKPFELKLERPVIVLDLETTGVHVEHDFIVELAVKKVFPNGEEDKRTMLINPMFPIPAEATKVHGITDEMVKGKPTFAQISKSLLTFIEGCDVIGFNSNRFDVPFLANMFRRVGLDWKWMDVNLIDVRNIFVQKEERTLTAAVKFYIGEDHEEAHSAGGDIDATWLVFLEQLGRYELPTDFKELALFSNYGNEIIDLAGKFKKNEAGVVVFNFGQHIGKPVKDFRSYLEWMSGPKGDFTHDTKQFIRTKLLS